jgi:hypothetical protein
MTNRFYSVGGAEQLLGLQKELNRRISNKIYIESFIMTMFPNFKVKKMSWWMRLILWFVPVSTAFDAGFDESEDYIVHFKEWRGKIYIIGEEKL